MTVPNLRDTYSRLYRVQRDPCADSWRDPLLHTIPTRTGCVYVHSATHAGIEVERRRRAIRRRLIEAGHPMHQDGDDLTTFLVPWAALEALLPSLRPYRRRKVTLTAEQRADVGRRLAEGRRRRIAGDTHSAAPTHADATGRG